MDVTISSRNFTAPPQSDVIPSENIDRAQIDTVASESGVEPETLANVAPYFDENRDLELQQNEIQQALSLATQNDIRTTNSVGHEIIPQHQVVQPTPIQAMQPMMQQLNCLSIFSSSLTDDATHCHASG